MSQYHQGPPVPVSSSPIFPLNAQPGYARRPSPLALGPRLSPPERGSGSSDLSDQPAVPNGQYQYGHSPPNSARSIPADWVGDATPVDLDVSKFNVHQRRGSRGSTDTSSPYTTTSSLPGTPVGWDAPLNPLHLVPYMPFPGGAPGNGTSFFYRSPTPSIRQRTNQACEKCRDRKTKCSGGRPTCVRCQARGLICEYASEHRIRGPAKARKRSVPALDPPKSASPTRTTFAHHPYAPRGVVDPSIWESQPVEAKAFGGQRSSWDLSHNSDELSEPAGATPYEQKIRSSYLGLNGTQGTEFVSDLPPPGFKAANYPFYRSQPMQASTGHGRGRISTPTLRVSASMPQLKIPGPSQSGGTEENRESSSSSMYSNASLSAQFADFMSEEESIRSRCTSSSSSSRASHSSPDEQELLSTGTSSNTIMFRSWSSNGSLKDEQISKFSELEEPVERTISIRDAEEDTPRPSLNQFNDSEWTTGEDYNGPSADYQFPVPEEIGTPEN